MEAQKKVTAVTWQQVALALFPGLLFAGQFVWRHVRWVNNASDSWFKTDWLPVVGCVLLLAAAWIVWRRLTVGGLVALGVVVVTAVPMLLDGLATQLMQLWFVLALVLSLLWLWQQRQRLVGWQAWLLLAVVVVNPLIAFLGGPLFMLPLALALWLSPRFGSYAALVLLPGLFALVDGYLDATYALTIWGGTEMTLLVLSLLPVVTLLLVAPLVLLWAQTPHKQAWGITVPFLVVSAVVELYRHGLFAGSTRGGYSLDMWLTRGGMLLQITLLLLLALSFGWRRFPQAWRQLP